MGLGVVVALADVGLEVWHDRAAHGAGGRPATLSAAVGLAEGALGTGVGLLAASVTSTSPAATSAPASAASLPPPVAAATVTPAAALLGRPPPIIPLSPRHLSSLRW